MKAVIMAGGEGTRLRPMSCLEPKPMTRLFDRPIMEYAVNLCKMHGISHLAATLCYMPKSIADWFGDGKRFGVNLEYFREKEALGTAGSVGLCRQFTNGEDFLVLSGDAVCDFNLSEAIKFHCSHNADVTIILSHQQTPVDYGLVLTGEDGRIERFIEKPSWSQVFTDSVNTGIYILSPRAMDSIPEGVKYDFARQLFPKMLAEGAKLYGFASDGYWCDVGDCGAYLKCMSDALDGRVDLGLPGSTGGVRYLSPVPEDAVVTAPSYIGKNVVIGAGAHIGPYACVGEGSRIGEDAVVERSSTDGADIGPRCRLHGSIVCRGAAVGPDGILGEECVVGDGAQIGRGTVLTDGVRVWPGKVCPDYSTVRFSVTSGARRAAPVIGEDGVIEGEANRELTPEVCVSLGCAMATASGDGARIGIGCDPGADCALLAAATEAGIRSCSGVCVRFGSRFAAQSAFASQWAGFDLCVHISRERMLLYGADGLPIVRELSGKLESLIKRADFRRADASSVGEEMYVSGLRDVYCRTAANQGRASGLSFSVGRGEGSAALANTMWLMGAHVAKADGVPQFLVSPDGLTLEAADENGRRLSRERMLLCAARAAHEMGMDTASSYSSPASLDELAADCGMRHLRILRDGDEGNRMYIAQPFMRDGVFRAAFIAAFMAKTGTTLSALASRTPEVCFEWRELPLDSDRARVMRSAAAFLPERDREYASGVRAKTSGGWVWLWPSGVRDALRVYAESANAETARELCEGMCERVKTLDSKIKRQK